MDHSEDIASPTQFGHALLFASLTVQTIVDCVTEAGADLGSVAAQGYTTPAYTGSGGY